MLLIAFQFFSMWVLLLVLLVSTVSAVCRDVVDSLSIFFNVGATFGPFGPAVVCVYTVFIVFVPTTTFSSLSKIKCEGPPRSPLIPNIDLRN